MKTLAQYVFMHGAAVLASAVMLVDLVRGTRSAFSARWKKVSRWLLIVLLCSWQVACWHAEASFDAAFSASPGAGVYKQSFLVLVLIWLIHQVVIHILKWRRDRS